MRIVSATAKNFASYKDLTFSFENQGLTLLHGRTGSGKSTLCDVVAWGLFGITSKGGSVNEVVSWPGTEVTEVTLHLDDTVITRKRGSKPKDNDLFYVEGDNVLKRGRDLQDTQKMINTLLGMNADLYLAGAYLHEFSQTSQFFTTTAKNRRLICEQLVDLTLAKTLHGKLSDKSKELDKEIHEVTQVKQKIQHTIDALHSVHMREVDKAANWTKEYAKRKESLQLKVDGFDVEQTKLVKKLIDRYENAIENAKKDKICGECGATKDHPGHLSERLVEMHEKSIQTEKNRENAYLSQMSELLNETNPYSAANKDYSTEIADNKIKLARLEDTTDKLQLAIDDVALLKEVTDTYRSTTIQTTIQEIESNTNDLLTKHFDSEIKVTFIVTDADKLEVEIMKDGNVASFTQLSKGQRCMLKLCFGVSVMKAVQNHAGVTFEQVFMDEALDGLDENLKTKAYGLLEQISLEYNSVFVVEHSSSLKTLFHNQIEIQLINGDSQLG